MDKFLELAKIKLENINYQVYFTGAKFIYENSNRTELKNYGFENFEINKIDIELQLLGLSLRDSK